MSSSRPRTPPPPTVTQLLVKGGNWTDAFLDHLDAQGLGHPTVARLGYRVPAGTNQLDALPWSNIDTITIVFSDDVLVEANDLTLHGTNISTYDAAAFSYDPATRTATWTFAEPLDTDRLSITLADTVRNVVDSELDGEWTNTVSAFPSGDGVAGGAFRFLFNILPGDVTGNGDVDIADASGMAVNWGSGGSRWMRADFNGDGQVDSSDAAVLTAHRGTRLPSWLLGDANVDGTVNEKDALIVTGHRHQAGGWFEGDFNGDGMVDDRDASIMAAHWRETVEMQTRVLQVETPEADPVVTLDARFIGPRQTTASPVARRRIEPCRAVGQADALTVERTAPSVAAAHDAALAAALDDGESLDYLLLPIPSSTRPARRRPSR